MAIKTSRTIACVSKAIGAEDTFSLGVFLRGLFNFSLSGTWVATVYVQRSFDKEVTWLDVDLFTTNTEEVGEDGEGAYYRFGIKAGGYTSGSVVGRLSQ